MSSFVAWARGLFRPRSREDRLEWIALGLALVCFLCGVAALVAGYRTLATAAESAWPAWRPQLAWAVGLLLASLVLLVLLLALAPVASPRLLGPVLFYDLIRSSRRARYPLIRGLYALTLLALLCMLFWVRTYNAQEGLTVSAREAADFASSFFATFMIVQLVVVTVVTPAYIAGAIAEEKERKTLEFLLATDLRGREIVFSKLVARLINLVLLVLTGLPVLAALQFLGGVDPGLVLAGFAATGLTVASLAGLSIANSAACRRARDAIVLTYLMAGAYLLISGLSWLLLEPRGWEDFPADLWPATPVKLRDVIETFNAGNIIAVLVLMESKVQAGTPFAEVLLTSLRNYALFHGFMALAGPLWAMARLRAVALQEASSGTVKAPPAPRNGPRSQAQAPSGRRITGPAMVWKEVVAESGQRLNLVGRLLVALLVPLSFLPALLVILWRLDAEAIVILLIFFAIVATPAVFLLAVLLGHRPRRGLLGPALLMGALVVAAVVLRGLGEGLFPVGSHSWREFREDLNIIQVRITGTAVSCLLLLAVAVRAAGSVTGERDRQTLDGLLTTPLDSDTILFSKWLGAIVSVRRGWLWLGAIWGLGVATGALHVLALPLLVVTWFVYAGFLAALGLWFSVASRSTLRATIATLVSAVGAGVGHWLLDMCCVPLVLLGPGQGGLADVLEWLAKFQVGLTPPLAHGYLLSFTENEFEGNAYRPQEGWEMVAFAILGAVVWSGLAAVLWAGTSARFRELSNRGPHERPRLRAQPDPAK